MAYMWLCLAVINCIVWFSSNLSTTVHKGSSLHACCVMCVVSCVLCHVCCVMCVVSCMLCHACCVMHVVSCVLCHVCCVMCVVSCMLCHVCCVLSSAGTMCAVLCYYQFYPPLWSSESERPHQYLQAHLPRTNAMTRRASLIAMDGETLQTIAEGKHH